MNAPAQPVARALDPIGHGAGGLTSLLGGALGMVKGAIVGVKALLGDVSTLISAIRVISYFLLLIPPPLGLVLRGAVD